MLPDWLASVAVKVPVVVTAVEGVADNTVPSPVKVTLVTVPVPLAGSAKKPLVPAPLVP